MKRIIVLLVVVSLVFSGCGASQADPAAESSIPESSVQESSVDASSSVEESSSEPPSSSELVGPVGIKGSHITDIMLGLEQTGVQIPRPELKASKDKSVSAHYCDATQENDVLGITFNYSLSADNEMALISGVFGTTTTYLVDEATFVEVSKGFFGFCSTMPCDAVSDGLARAWLEDVFDHLPERESGTNIIFGDAKYQLEWTIDENGQVSSIWMIISRVDPAAEAESEASEPESQETFHYVNPPKN